MDIENRDLLEARAALLEQLGRARGVLTVPQEKALQYVTEWKLGPRNSRLARRFLERFRGDQVVKVAPWFDPTSDQDTFAELELCATGVDEAAFLFEKPAALDVHPSVPVTWRDGAPTMLVTARRDVADALLAAVLEPHLQPEDRDALRANPAAQLPVMLDRVPSEEQVLVVAAKPMGFSSDHPAWFQIPLSGRQVLIHPSGDVHRSREAWLRATSLLDFLEGSRRADPYFIDAWQSEVIERARASRPNYGLLELLAEGATWGDVQRLAIKTLPPRPIAVSEAIPGEWRVALDGFGMEECVQVFDARGRAAGHRWQTTVPIAGRILGSDTHRRPTKAERRGEGFGAGASLASSVTARLELAWTDKLLGEVTGEVVGPEVILEKPPSEWSVCGANIPTALRRQPKWPIAGRDGRRWLEAVKDNLLETPLLRTSWETMGWVPVPDDDVQAFVVGQQVLAVNERALSLTVPGAAPYLAGAGRFGVDDPYGVAGLTQPDAVKQLRGDLEHVYETYLRNSPWIDGIGAINLAVGLRPAVPLQTHVVIYHHGPPHKGKSWTARQQLAFWQHSPGTWKSSLTGSAGDTFAASEDAVARAPIWVLDDLAPSSDRRRAAAQEDTTGSMVRGVHNSSAKRRMSHDMTVRAVAEPLALLVVTAENEASIRSINQRMVRVQYNGLVDEHMGAVERLNYRTTTASRVTAALIRLYMHEAGKAGWREMVKHLDDQAADDAESVRKVLIEQGVNSADSTRTAEMTADLLLGLRGFEKLLHFAGLSELADTISWEDSGLLRQVALHAAGNAADSSTPSPGVALFEAIRNLLRAGHAHILNFDEPGKPPTEEETWNQLLGWQRRNDEWEPRGARIGGVKSVRGKGRVVIISDSDAFNLAQEKYRSSLPFGTNPRNAWQDVWAHKLVHPAYVDARPQGRSNIQFKVDAASIYGQPFAVEQLIR